MQARAHLIELGERIAQEGPARHERALGDLAAMIADRAPGTSQVLRDVTAPTVLRQRAFAVAADVALRDG